MVDWTSWISLGLLGAVLAAAAVSDARSARVPNALTYPAILLGLAWAIVAGAIHAGVGGAAAGLGGSMFGLGVGLVPFAMIFAIGGIGGGDVKLMAAVGAIGGWKVVLGTTVYGLVIAAVIAVAIVIRRGLVMQTAYRLFGAALMVSARVKPDIPEDSPKIPLAVALGIGGILAGLEVLAGVRMPWGGF